MSIRAKAKRIDHILENIHSPLSAFSLRMVEKIVPQLFPDSAISGRGQHKLVFKISYNNQPLILKVGKKEIIEYEHRVYKTLPKDVRRDVFARIFWHTKYCLLQEYGEETSVSKEELSRLQDLGDRYGLRDISCDNIKKVNGKLKLVDAMVAEGRFLTVARKFESMRTNHPHLYRFLTLLWHIVVRQR